jgi:cytochrome P450
MHTDHRSLLLRLITPRRLKGHEEFMWRLADRQLDSFLTDGSGEFITEFANPFAMLVIADLLGVPEEDHPRFTRALLHSPSQQGGVGGIGEETMEHSPLGYLYQEFTT